MDERLNNIEDMLSQLIKMVAKNNEEQKEMKLEQQEFKQELNEFKQEQQEFKQELNEFKQELYNMKQEQQELRDDVKSTKESLFKLDGKVTSGFSHILDQFKILKVDQDVSWEKVSRVERDVEKLKKIN